MLICRFSLACALLGLAAACATPRQRVATYTVPMLSEAMPSRIVVVPFGGPSCTADAKKMITESIAHEMQSVLLSEIIVASLDDDDRLAAENAVQRSGRVDISVLVSAQKRYSADAFLFGTVTQYKPYDPPVVGLSLNMLSARTGEVLWAAETVFDAHDREVRWMVEQYFKKSGLSHRLGGPDLVFMSPRLFSRFVAFEVVRPLREQVPAYGSPSSGPTAGNK